jgi:hypothetical protein
MMDIEFVHISADYDPVRFEQELLFADCVWRMNMR